MVPRHRALVIGTSSSSPPARWSLGVRKHSYIATIPDSAIRALELLRLENIYTSPSTSSVPFGDVDSHPFP
ncbi:hypothetical protein EXIGLDRAFT_734813 [Exidia glandulosa HHB12029]|uniref:Uncharacterized protein n=1 Tax=Exidia glandulosa HHB12029 TaxID=1314781 RepID=A0A165K4J4_EXIGL|nr:hypothetical protein EXIGLDRAFT_734813 [Exidia glandulosa HHB12029]